MIDIVILGGGNVAYHLIYALLQNSAVNVVQVYNRSLEKIDCFKSGTSITNNLSELKDADVYILAVSDNIISELSSTLNLKNKLVVHTSGSMALDELKSVSDKGVFYLLQSFSKERKIDFSTVPICVEAENENDLMLLETLANGWLIAFFIGNFYYCKIWWFRCRNFRYLLVCALDYWSYRRNKWRREKSPICWRFISRLV